MLDDRAKLLLKTLVERYIASGARLVLWDIDEALLAKAKASLGAAASTARSG